MNDCESNVQKQHVKHQQRVETHFLLDMMIGSCAWFCCVAKIARQTMILVLFRNDSERNTLSDKWHPQVLQHDYDGERENVPKIHQKLLKMSPISSDVVRRTCV